MCICQLKVENLAVKRKIAILQAKIASVIDKEGVEMDDATSSDLYQIMTEQSATMDKLPEDSFRCIYWNQQMGAAKKHRNGM